MPIVINNPTQQVSGVILTGGFGSRLGGVDKGLVEWQGRPLVEHILERLKPQVADIVISANRNREDYLKYGWPVVADQSEHEWSPLGGVLAGGRAAQLNWLLFVPVDSPFMPRNLSFRLASSMQGLARRAHDGRETQSDFALVHRHRLFDAYRQLVSGEIESAAWLDRVKSASVYFGDQMGAFFDINTPEDAHRADSISMARGPGA